MVMREFFHGIPDKRFSPCTRNGVIGLVNTILKRLYPDELANSNYSQTLSSLAFAGTVVGSVTSYFCLLT